MARLPHLPAFGLLRIHFRHAHTVCLAAERLAEYSPSFYCESSPLTHYSVQTPFCFIDGTFLKICHHKQVSSTQKEKSTTVVVNSLIMERERKWSSSSNSVKSVFSQWLFVFNMFTRPRDGCQLGTASVSREFYFHLSFKRQGRPVWCMFLNTEILLLWCFLPTVS